MLMPNAQSFDLKEFPKDIVETYVKGGAIPALVVMRKQYSRAKPGWCERAIDWLEQNMPRAPEFARPGVARLIFKPGDIGTVATRDQKVKSGAQTVQVIKTINEGRVLQVVDTLSRKEYFMFADMLVPKAQSQTA